MPRMLIAAVAVSMLAAFGADAQARNQDHGRHDRGTRSERSPDQRYANRYQGERGHGDWNRRDVRNDGWRRDDRYRDRREWTGSHRPAHAYRVSDGRRYDAYRDVRQYPAHGYRHDYRYDYRRDYAHHDRFYGPRYRVAAYYRPYGYRPYRWYPGARLPAAYYAPRYVIYDYHPYGLRPPPYGYHWVRVDNDVVLAAIATGIVLQVVDHIFW